VSRGERFSEDVRDEVTFCDVCGRKIPITQIAGKCSNCYKMLCSRCVDHYAGRIYCVDCSPKPPPPPPPVESSSRCFIATAAYGTPLASEIQVLRDFRDQRLNTNPIGRKVTAFYYLASPRIADKISKKQLRRKIVRAVLDPIVQVFIRLGH
jgi:hypothetical protein